MTDIVDQAKSVASTFTNWDTCMSKTYCKWPVIAAIIIGALICLSVLWCLMSCCCLGVTFCGACVKCLTCCHCCRDCGGGGGGRRRNKDAEYGRLPSPYQGYQPQPSPMMYNNAGPQFATFDTGNKRVHEDSLPAMPSWDTAATRRVEDHSPQHQQQASAMEMERMLPHQNVPMSPIREQPYHQAQPYASDLGTQRLGEHGGNASYYDTPLSPAPTYRTTAPAGGAFASTERDRFSPQQNHYQESHSYSRGNAPSVAPYPSSRESTQFASQRSMSPPSAPSYNSYQSQALDESQGVRPPSLLQVGRKPVAGSYREV